MIEDLMRTPPLLIDIIDAEPCDIDDFDAFLSSWRTALAEYDFRIERENWFLVGLFYQNTLVFARS